MAAYLPALAADKAEVLEMAVASLQTLRCCPLFITASISTLVHFAPLLRSLLLSPVQAINASAGRQGGGEYEA